MVSREYFCHPRGICERETVLDSSLPAYRDEHAFVHTQFVQYSAPLVNDSGYPNLHARYNSSLWPVEHCKALHYDGVSPLYAIIGVPTLCDAQ
jgi:hypothetical protein